MLAINQLIKIIIGVVVIAVVVTGLYFFGSYVSDFFGNMIGGEEEEKEDIVVKEKTVEDKEEVSPNPCEECDTGFFDTCSKIECESLGNCDFKPHTLSSDECTQIK